MATEQSKIEPNVFQTRKTPLWWLVKWHVRRFILGIVRVQARFLIWTGVARTYGDIAAMSPEGPCPRCVGKPVGQGAVILQEDLEKILLRMQELEDWVRAAGGFDDN